MYNSGNQVLTRICGKGKVGGDKWVSLAYMDRNKKKKEGVGKVGQNQFPG